MAQARSIEQRKADTLATLAAVEADVWVASASSDGMPHLVPLSYAWVDDEIVIALDASSKTAVNIERAGTARLGFGPTRDVIMMDVALGTIEPAGSSTVADAYATQAVWDPRGMAGMVFIRLRPTRIQAWREENELRDRTLMSNSVWRV